MSEPRNPEEPAHLSERDPALIELPVERMLTPVDAFAHSQASTGIALLIAVIAALAMANLGYSELYFSLNHLPLGISLGEWSVSMSLHHWVNDGLMVLFFFLLGLEIKRELIAGELRDLRKSMLVLHMALGGMIVPALIYAGIVALGGGTGIEGWGIPMATDTAFALGILGMLGTRAPVAATLLLTALAILDDLGAVLVISVFYTDDLDLLALIGGFFALLVLGLFNLAGIRRPLLYFVGGVALWWCILQSGVHSTTAGVLAATMVPSRPYASTSWFQRRMKSILRRFERLDHDDLSILEEKRQHSLAQQAREVALKATTPLQRWENFLDRPVSLAVLPLFAFLNAGVALAGEDSALAPSHIGFAVATGLVLGKILGITSFAWAGLKMGWCSLPKGFRFVHLFALGALAGIGFTMSLFIAGLAFEQTPALLDQAKIGILSGSLLAGILGTALFLLNPPGVDQPTTGRTA